MDRLIFAFILILAIGCSGNEQPQETAADTASPAEVEKVATDTISETSFAGFLANYNQLVSSIVQNDAPSFNRFIHPVHGLCIIESGGAMPQMRNGKDIGKFRTIAGKSFFEVYKTTPVCELKEEELPKIDCNKPELWSKTGCFTQEVNTFKDEKIWEHCGLQDKEETIAAKSAETITRTVINTNGYRYYFSRINSRWYLTFLDLRVPCSA